MNISKKQQLVLDAINEYPEAANDDALLLSVVWEKEGWCNGAGLYYNLFNVTRPETITRRRRELFNMGLITYSDKALDERTEAFKKEKEADHNNYSELLDKYVKPLTKIINDDHTAVSWLNDED